jgi:type IV pilus assembly protein PilM
MSMIEDMENVSRTVLSCPQCHEDNLPQWNYCAQCGAALWEVCLRCSEPCAAGENYCGACGACLSDAAAEQVERLEAAFREAAEMESAFRFEEAIDLLGPIAKYDHPRLAAYASRAAALIRQLTADRARRRVAAQEACRIARQAFDACDYDGAAALLEEVPPSLRGGEIEDILTQIALRRREIAIESDGLHEAVRQKRLLDLPPRIERLLALKPDHAYAKSVAGQVQKRFVAVAKKMLAEHRYDQAQHLLDQISVRADATDFQRVRQQAAELGWLDWDLRNAPVVDDTLVAVAERLRRLAPDDARNIRLCDELQRRTRLAKGGQYQQPLQWASPPEQTPLGVPVEWLTGFRRVTCAETLDRSELLRHPGRFAMACGLALAGIRQAALRINLLSARHQGVLRRITHLMRSQSARSAWGLDLGTSGLKAVKLAWNEAKHQAVIEAVTLIEHAKPLSHAANEAEEARLVTETLKAFLGVQETKTERVCVGLPGRMTLSRQIKVPPVDPAKAAKLVQFEAAHQFPFPLEQLAWDFQLLDNASPDLDCGAETSGEKVRRAILIAAKRTTTEHFLDAFRLLDMRVDVLQTDFVALHNFLAYDYFAAPDDSPSGEACPVVAALDIGCDVTNIVVSSPQSLWFRSCGMAGRSFTRALVKEFNLSIAQAEQRKRAPESTEHLIDLYEALSPVFDDLLKEVQQSLVAYGELQPNRPVQRVLGLGGGFSLHGLFRHLRCGR